MVTHCIPSFCLTLEKPSALSVALCLAHAMWPKAEWLAVRDIKHWMADVRPTTVARHRLSQEFKELPSSVGARTMAFASATETVAVSIRDGVVERRLGRLNSVLATQRGSTALRGGSQRISPRPSPHCAIKTASERFSRK